MACVETVGAGSLRAEFVYPPISRSDVLLWKRPARIWHVPRDRDADLGGGARANAPRSATHFPIRREGANTYGPRRPVRAVGPHAPRPTCEASARCAARAVRCGAGGLAVCRMCARGGREAGRRVTTLRMHQIGGWAGGRAHPTPGPPAWTASWCMDTDGYLPIVRAAGAGRGGGCWRAGVGHIHRGT